MHTDGISPQSKKMSALDRMAFQGGVASQQGGWLTVRTALPSWLSFNVATRTFSGTPPANFVGSLTLKVTASDAGNLSASDTFTLSVTPVNDAPVIASNGGNAAASISLPENVADVTTITASDVDDDAVFAFAIIGGDDASKFKIDNTTGALSFKFAADFEHPNDANGDGKYDVMVQASDGRAADVQAITVTVKNVKGVSASGTSKADRADASHSLGGKRPSGEEDTLKGKDGDDRLSGLGGNDMLYGGKGKDKLNGGDGEDAFVFDTKLDQKKNVDAVADFVHADDVFWLDRDAFAGLVRGKLSKDAFHVGKEAADKEDRILYDKKHGDVYFDRDGSKSHYDPVKFASVDDNTRLDHTDFLII